MSWYKISSTLRNLHGKIGIIKAYNIYLIKKKYKKKIFNKNDNNYTICVKYSRYIIYIYQNNWRPSRKSMLTTMLYEMQLTHTNMKDPFKVI